MTSIKQEIKERARLTRGLANALGYCADYVYTDVKNFDLMCLDESLRDAKDTLQKLTDNLTELEYLVYLIKKEI